MDSEPTGQIIKITERDLKEEKLTCVDLDNNIWIKEGFPKNSDTGIIDGEVMRNLSGPPYVFKADLMNLYDEKHPNGVELKDVGVIFMHGGRKEGGKWMFDKIEDGYPVVETVRVVNEYLKQRGESPVEVVMACNYSSPSDVKVGDFNADENIVYAVGETVGMVNAGMSEEGKIHFKAIAKDFWGLDELAISQQVKVL